MSDRGNILTGDVAMITEGIICKTCKELERKDKQNTQERISLSQRMVLRAYVGAVSMGLWEMDGML